MLFFIFPDIFNYMQREWEQNQTIWARGAKPYTHQHPTLWWAPFRFPSYTDLTLQIYSEILRAALTSAPVRLLAHSPVGSIRSRKAAKRQKRRALWIIIILLSPATTPLLLKQIIVSDSNAMTDWVERTNHRLPGMGRQLCRHHSWGLGRSRTMEPCPWHTYSLS